MNLQKMSYLFIGLAILSLVFYLGFLYGNRQSYNQQPNLASAIANNQSRRNSLSDIQVADIWGAVTNQKSAGYGQLYFKVSENQTEILIRLRNVPLKINATNSSLDLPNSFEIKTASLSLDGLDYQYQTIGIINLDEPNNGLRNAEFSTILDYSIYSTNKAIQRIVFQAPGNSAQNLFLDEDPNLPAQVRKNPSPFFWVVLAN